MGWRRSVSSNGRGEGRPISLALGPVHNWQLNCLPGPVNIAERADRCDDSRYMQMFHPVNCLHKIKNCSHSSKENHDDDDDDDDKHREDSKGGFSNLLTSIATFCAHDTADCRAQMSAQILSACGPRLCERVGHCSMNVTCVWHHLRLQHRQLLLPFLHCPGADYASASDDRSSFCDRRSQWADPPPGRPAWVMDIIALDPTIFGYMHGAFGAFGAWLID